MFPKKHLINIAFMTSLTSLFAASAHADIPGDIAAGVPASQVLANAMATGASFTSAITTMAGINRDMALAAVKAAIQASPEKVIEIAAAVAAAIPQFALDVATTAAAVVPDSAEAIAQAVQTAVPQLNPNAIQIAVASGVEQSQQLAGGGADYIPDEAPAAGEEATLAPPPLLTAPTVTTPPSVSPS